MSLKRNIFSNLAARVWTALMSFAFVPLYLRYLGAEGYGLIGLFVTILSIFGLLDLGLGMMINREAARASAAPNEREDLRSLMRTLEWIYWTVGALLGLAVFLAAPVIAKRWVNLEVLDSGSATTAIRLMGAAIVVRWPVAIYLGAMLGMGRQVLVNAITTAGSTLAGAGAVLVLWLWQPRIEAYFAWQVVAFAVQIAALRIATWRGMPAAGHRPRFRLDLMRRTAAFSAGISGITLVSLVLTQLDKALLTRMLPLEDFGHYTLAFGIAGLLTTAGGTIETAAFPALARAVAAGDRAQETALYHKASQALAVLLMPAAVTLALFSHELLTAYVGAGRVADQTFLLLSLLAVGNALLACDFMPLALQLAHGWTKLSLYKNLVAIVFYVPALFVLIRQFGAMGAALSWIGLTAGYMLFEVPIMHRRLQRGEMARWYWQDMGVPLAICCAILGTAKTLIPAGLSMVTSLCVIAASAMTALSLCVLALPQLRGTAANTLNSVVGSVRIPRGSPFRAAKENSN